MAVTLLLGGVTARQVVVRVSPLAELTACLHAITESEHHPQAVPLARRARADYGEPLYQRIRDWAPLWSAYRARLLLPLSQNSGSDVDDELAELAALPLARFAELTAFALRGGYSGSPMDRVLTDAEQQRALVAATATRSSRRTELAEALIADADAVRAALLAFLAEVAATWTEQTWRDTRPALAEDATRLRELVRGQGPGAALAELSTSATLLADPQRVVYDKFHHGIVRLRDTGLVLVPSVYGWPHLLIKHETGLPTVVHYPVRQRTRAEVPFELLKQRIGALTDPGRMRLCRAIAREPLTTTMLAERSGMTVPQVSRHLRRLRELGLVASSRDGRSVYYQLDLDSARRLGDDLVAALFR